MLAVCDQWLAVCETKTAIIINTDSNNNSNTNSNSNSNNKNNYLVESGVGR